MYITHMYNTYLILNLFYESRTHNCLTGNGFSEETQETEGTAFRRSQLVNCCMLTFFLMLMFLLPIRALAHSWHLSYCEHNRNCMARHALRSARTEL